MKSKRYITKKYMKCDVCGCRSKVYYKAGDEAGMFSGHNSLDCPGEEKYTGWHEELEEKLELLNEPHPKIYKDALKKEITLLRKKFSNIKPKNK